MLWMQKPAGGCSFLMKVATGSGQCEDESAPFSLTLIYETLLMGASVRIALMGLVDFGSIPPVV